MLIKFIFSILGSIIIYFLGLQFIQLLDLYLLSNELNDLTVIMQFSPWFDYRYFFMSERNRQLFGLISLWVVVFVVFVWIPKGSKSSGRRIKNQYQSDSFNRFSSVGEMKRSTSLTEFDSFGGLNEVTFRSCWLLLTDLFRKFYNALKLRAMKPTREFLPLFDNLSRGGVPVVAERRFWFFGKYSRVWSLYGNSHNLFVGSTGRGKSMTFVIQMLFSYLFSGESMVVHDPKHELRAYTEKSLHKRGYDVISLDWTSPIHSEGWNPLTAAWDRYKEVFMLMVEDDYKGNNVIMNDLFRKSNLLDQILHVQKEISDSKKEIKSLFRDIIYETSEDPIENDLSNLLAHEEDIYDFYISEKERLEGFENKHDNLIDELNAFEEINSKDDVIAKLVKYDNNPKANSGLSTAVEYTMDVANALAYDENARDKNWGEGAADMITGAALYLMEEAVLNCVIKIQEDNTLHFEFPLEKYIHLYSVSKFYDDLSKVNGMKELLEKVNRYPNADSVQKMATFANSQSATRGSYFSQFSNSLKYITSSPAIRSMTSHSTFKMEDLFKGRKAIFLLTHDEKSTYYPLVSIFFKQLYEVGIKETRSASDGKLKIPMNFIIDEMGMMPAIKDIQNMYGAARSRNIRINAFIQSLEQLELKYGRQITKVIEDNSSNHIFLGAATEETQRRFQSKAGNRIVWNKSKQQYEEVPLIRKEELNLIAKGHSLIISIERYPFLARLPMVTQYAYWSKDLMADMSSSTRSVKVHENVDFFRINEEWIKTKLDESEKEENKTDEQGVMQYTEEVKVQKEIKKKTKTKGVSELQTSADNILFENNTDHDIVP